MGGINNPGPHPVPPVDGSGNVFMRDVIGNRSDGHDTDSVAGRLHMVHDHFHKPMDVFPTGVSGVTVTAGDAEAWDLGDFAVVVAANDITSPFDIHFVVVEAMSADATYELILFSGVDASEVEIAHARFVRITNILRSESIPIQTPINVANGQIKAKLMSSSGAANTATISLAYHLY